MYFILKHIKIYTHDVVHQKDGKNNIESRARYTVIRTTAIEVGPAKNE